MPTIALPRDVAAAVVVSGLSTALRAVAVSGLVLTAVMTIDVAVSVGLDRAQTLIFVAPVVSSVLVAVLLLALPSRATAALYLGAGAVAAAATVVVSVSMAGQGTDPYLINRVATALPLVGGLAGSARSGLRWTASAMVIAYAALGAGWWALGITGPLGYGPLIVGTLALVGFGLLAAVRFRAKKSVPELLAVQRAVLIDARERELQRRAAAAVHDTVLADLAVVSMSSGPIDNRMRDHILRDLDAIVRPTAARTVAAEVAVHAPHGLALALVTLANDYRWKGVTVQVSGTEELTTAVPIPVVDALVGATRAALDNVVAHANTEHAELVVGQRDDAIAVLVVDSGCGFAVDDVRTDRLGLRESIMGRVQAVGGSVRVWSGEEGTTVMMRVPLGSADGR